MTKRPFLSILPLIAWLSLLSGEISSANATTVDTRQSLKDTTLRGDSHNLNEGANTVLLVGEMDQEGPDADGAEDATTTVETDAEGEAEEPEAGRVLVAFPLPDLPIRVTKATLILTINSDMPPFGWETQDAETNLLDLHRVALDWREGNGSSLDRPRFERLRGTGSGTTWVCPTDADISNRTPTCSPKSRWDGAARAVLPRTSPAAPVSDGLAGELSWDVTQDVLDGAVNGWIIMKRREDAGGTIRFHSREAATLLGDADLAPRLVLENPVFEVGSAGGTIITAGGNVTLTIPPGAIAGPERVGITVDPIDPSAGVADVGLLPGSAYDLGPDGLEFAQPVQLAIKYNPAEIPPGMQENQLTLLSADHSGGAWVMLVSSVDPTLDTVTAGIRHFSHFGVGPEVATVEVRPSPLDMNLDSTERLTATPLDALGNPLRHQVDWFSSDQSIAEVQGGVVTARGVGTTTITAVTHRLDASGAVVPGASGSAAVKVSSSRHVHCEGQIYVFDQDNLSSNEDDTFEWSGDCFVNTWNQRQASFDIGGDSTCVDDEVMMRGGITCTLQGDNRSVLVRVEASLYESDKCPNDDFEGNDERNIWLIDGGFEEETFLVGDEDDDYTRIHIACSNRRG